MNKKVQSLSLYLLLGFLLVILFIIGFYIFFLSIDKQNIPQSNEKIALNNMLQENYNEITSCLLHRIGLNGGNLIINSGKNQNQEFNNYIVDLINLKLKNIDIFQGKRITKNSPSVTFSQNENDITFNINHPISIISEKSIETIENFFIKHLVRLKYLLKYRDRLQKQEPLKLDKLDIDISSVEDIDIDVNFYQINGKTIIEFNDPKSNLVNNEFKFLFFHINHDIRFN